MTLLMAWALDLDPNLNLTSSQPVAVIDQDTLSISFYAANSGITFIAETSTDMRRWVTAGATLSPLDLDHRTASVSRVLPGRFLRLRVRLVQEN